MSGRLEFGWNEVGHTANPDTDAARWHRKEAHGAMTDVSTRLTEGNVHIDTSATPSTTGTALPPADSTVILLLQPFPVAAMLIRGYAGPAASQDVSTVSAMWISVDANITIRLSCIAHRGCALAVAISMVTLPPPPKPATMKNLASIALLC